MGDNVKCQTALQAKCQLPHDTRKLSVDFYVYEEGNLHIAYCPALDLTTTGTDFNDAVSQFHEALQLYVECCVDEGTL